MQVVSGAFLGVDVDMFRGSQVIAANGVQISPWFAESSSWAHVNLSCGGQLRPVMHKLNIKEVTDFGGHRTQNDDS